jgi:hypothetical protein
MICLGGKGNIFTGFVVQGDTAHDGTETAKAGRSTQRDVDGSVVVVGLRLLVSLGSADSGSWLVNRHAWNQAFFWTMNIHMLLVQ